jgi:hypothetical protein
MILTTQFGQNIQLKLLSAVLLSCPKLKHHHSFSARSFLGIILFTENLCGGGGNIPNFPNIHATRSDGCAPTDIQ